MADYYETMLPFCQRNNRYLKKMFHTHARVYLHTCIHTYIRTCELRKYVYFLMCKVYKVKTIFLYKTILLDSIRAKEEILICNAAENVFALIILKCISRIILQQQLTNGSPQITVYPGYDIQRAQVFGSIFGIYPLHQIKLLFDIKIFWPCIYLV